MFRFTACDKQTIKVFDGAQLLTAFSPHSTSINCLRHDSKGRVLLSAADNSLIITELNGQRPVSLQVIKENILSCDFTYGSKKLIVTGGTSKLVQVYNLRSKTPVKAYEGHQSSVFSVRFSRGDTHLFSGSQTGQIIVHSVVSGQKRGVFQRPGSQGVRSLEVSPFHSSYVGTGNDDGAVDVWSANTGQRIYGAAFHHAPCTSMCFAPFQRDHFISLGLDKCIHMYALQSRRWTIFISSLYWNLSCRCSVLGTIKTDAPLPCGTYSANGLYFIAGTTSGRVLVYDLRKTSSAISNIEAFTGAVISIVAPIVSSLRSEKQQQPSPIKLDSLQSLEPNASLVASNIHQSTLGGLDCISPIKTEPDIIGANKENRKVLRESHLNHPRVLEEAQLIKKVKSPQIKENPLLEKKEEQHKVHFEDPTIDCASDTPPPHYNQHTKQVSLDNAATTKSKSVQYEEERSNHPELRHFPLEAMKELLEEHFTGMKQFIRAEIQTVHMEIIEQFYTQTGELGSKLDTKRFDEELMKENMRLREENERLKRNIFW
ncbi:protein NEDD1-like isoform X2 [Zophobas morio]|uniref:protein NEDD1-like isoform X2 n=1 Tax=Zophobas morio TaxID=2755281 RepID=UPI003083D107